MVEDLIDKLTTHISESGREGDISEARAVYFSDAGSLHGDEATYDMRIANFLEWYIFDRTTGGKTFLDDFIDFLEDPEEKKIYGNLKGGVRTVFEIKKVDDDLAQFIDLRNGKRYFAVPLCSMAGLSRGELIDARLLPNEDKYYLTGSYIVHPNKTKKFIVNMLKDADNRQDMGSALRMLANMSLKWERFRNYRLEDIYKIKES
jgi:hypothetical protein